MPRPQFTLRALLVAVSLAAVGLGLTSTDPDTRLGMCLLSIGAWACWGAAIGALFGRAARGALIGAALILPLVVAAMCVPIGMKLPTFQAPTRNLRLLSVFI